MERARRFGTRARVWLLLLWLAYALAACSPAAPRPVNLVILGLDTTRFDAFWLPERAGIEDRLSPWTRRALRFTKARSPAPWTLPAVASVLTGRYPVEHGAGSYRGIEGDLATQLPPPLIADVPTLTSLLSTQGFLTAAFVNQAFFHPLMGLARGFETLRFGNDRERLVTDALGWLDSLEALPYRPPFFLYLHFLEAHREHLLPRAEKIENIGAMDDELRRAAVARAPAKLCNNSGSDDCLTAVAYANSVLKLRDSIARVLEALRERKLLERTVVAVYSDHGEELYDHLPEELARNTNPRTVRGIGHGHAMYEELLHVPLVVWHPQLAGRDVEIPMSLVDLVPTLEEWLRLDLGIAWSGASLVARVSDEQDAGGPGRALFASGMAQGPPETVVYRDHWKLIVRTDPDEEALYDLDADPGEKHPLTRARVARELRQLAETHDASARPPVPLLPEMPSEQVRQLQALGYVGQVPDE